MKMLLVVVGGRHLVRHDGEKLTVALVIVSIESIQFRRTEQRTPTFFFWLSLVGCGEFGSFDQILQPPHCPQKKNYS